MTPCSVVMLEEYLVMGFAAMMLGPLAVAGRHLVPLLRTGCLAVAGNSVKTVLALRIANCAAIDEHLAKTFLLVRSGRIEVCNSCEFIERKVTRLFVSRVETRKVLAF